jgi:hypothetical protein
MAPTPLVAATPYSEARSQVNEMHRPREQGVS